MHRVGLIVPRDFQLLNLAPLTAFEMTAFEIAKPPPAAPHYELHLLSEHGGPVRSSCGLTVETEAFGDPFPDVRMEEDRIYINDGPIWTSAGMSAGIDLVLAMIDKDLGPEVAKAVAKLLVINQRRIGGQKQHSALLDLVPKSDRIDLVLTHIRQNLQSSLSVEELADVARLSPRQFSRAFLAETGQSPAKAVERLRLEAARVMMEEGRHSGNVVAEETGFAGRERMRRAFVRTFGLPPQALRRKARLEATG